MKALAPPRWRRHPIGVISVNGLARLIAVRAARIYFQRVYQEDWI